jgi:hypothetical protein
MKMKIKSLFVAVLLMAGVVVAPADAADDSAWQKPVLNTFSFTPNEVELSSGKTDVEITLTVTHSLGISNQSVIVHLENSVYGGNFAYSTSISRTDSPVNTKLNSVTFKGILKLDPSMPAGIWEFRSESLTPNSDPTLGNFTPRSATFTPAAIRDFAGGETALLVRKSGYLNFDFKTFSSGKHPRLINNWNDRVFLSSPHWRTHVNFLTDHLKQLDPYWHNDSNNIELGLVGQVSPSYYLE